jgi:hypothetical protein
MGNIPPLGGVKHLRPPLVGVTGFGSEIDALGWRTSYGEIRRRSSRIGSKSSKRDSNSQRLHSMISLVRSEISPSSLAQSNIGKVPSHQFAKFVIYVIYDFTVAAGPVLL